jgi:hypothetical protein
MTEGAHQFAQAANFIGALRTKELVEASREQLGGSAAFDVALGDAVSRCRAFIASAKTVDGIVSLSKLGDALAMLDNVATRNDDRLLAAAAVEFLRQLGMP